MSALILAFLKIDGVDVNTDRTLPTKAKLAHMDPLGAIILVAAVCSLLLGLQWGGSTLPWRSSKVIGLFIGFGVLSIVFGILQWKLGEKATISPRVLRQRSVLMGSAFLFFLQMTLYAVRRSRLILPWFQQQLTLIPA